jgi:stage V sporulation protein SpoVS
MTTRSWVKVLAALAVVVLLALAMWSFDATQDPSAPTAEERSVSPSASAPLEPAAEPFANATQAPSTRTPIAETEPPPLELVVTVVDGFSNAPVAGATVFVEREDLDPVERELTQEHYGSDAAQVAERLGAKFVCDASGVVRVPRPKGSVMIWAQNGDHYGCNVFERGDEEVQVDLYEHFRVHVEIVDGRGVPASGVDVRLFEPRLDEWEDAYPTTTDEHGRAVFVIERPDPTDEPVNYRLATPFVACEPEFHEFASSSPPSDVFRLTIGDTGSVELFVTNSDAKRVEVPALLTLEVNAEVRDALAFGLANGGRRSTPTAEGRARFERIGLGLRLHGGAYLHGYRFSERTITGPGEAGESISSAVPIEQVQSLMRGRIVDPDGKPLAQRRLLGRTLLSYADGSAGEVDVLRAGRSDEDGRFEVLMAYFHPGQIGPTIEILARRAGGASATGSAPIPQPIQEGVAIARDVYDLGEVVLTVQPAFVCGQVFDEYGVATGRVSVEFFELDADGAQRFRGVEYAAGDGAFEFRCADCPESLLVRATSESHATGEPHTVTRGQTDVALRLGEFIESGAIRGKLLLPQGADGEELHLQFTRSFGSSSGVGYERTSAGEFLADRLLPGAYSLRVILQGKALAHIEGIEVAPTKTTMLEPIDLRERVHTISVCVRDSVGAPIRAATVRMLDEDINVSNVETDAKGCATLTSLSTSYDLLVSAVGFQPRVILGATSGLEVALDAGLDVQIRRPELGEAARDFELHVELCYVGPELPGVHSDHLVLALPSEAPTVVRLPFAGRYELFDAKWIHRVTRAEWPLELPDEPLIAVVGERAEFTLDWPTAALLEALERARPK